MFSYFINGIKNLKPTKTIDFSNYVELIKGKDFEELLIKVQNARAEGHDDLCSALKRKLPYFTPHCIVKWRNLENQNAIEKNFVLFSGYIYFDIDEFPQHFTVSEYKNYLINKLKNHASLISYSASRRGLCVIFKVKNEITFDGFKDLRQLIIEKYLPDEVVDPNAAGILRVQYLTFDPDVFVSYENSITIEINHQKMGIQCNSESGANIILNPDISINKAPQYKIYDIKEVLNKIVLQTKVPVENPIVDFKEVEVVKSFVPRVIVDTKKHKTYYILIHQLYLLNPDLEIDYIFSYIFCINNSYAKPKMEFKKLVNHFNNVIKQIRETGIIYKTSKIKRVHFNENSNLSSFQKNIIAKKLNSAYRKKVTIEKIEEALTILSNKGIKTTNKAISKITGLDVGTIKLRRGNERIYMNYEISLWNNSLL